MKPIAVGKDPLPFVESLRWGWAIEKGKNKKIPKERVAFRVERKKHVSMEWVG